MNVEKYSHRCVIGFYTFYSLNTRQVEEQFHNMASNASKMAGEVGFTLIIDFNTSNNILRLKTQLPKVCFTYSFCFCSQERLESAKKVSIYSVNKLI